MSPAILSKSDFITLNLLQEGIWVSDASDQLVFVNSAMARIAGTDVSRLEGKSLLMFPEETLRHFLGFLNLAKESLLPCEYECPVVTPAGRLTWQGGWLTPLIKEGCYAGMICTVNDITGRKHIEEREKISERCYREVVQDQTEIISRISPDGTYVFVNNVYCRLFGKTREELIGQRWLPVAHPDDLLLIEAKLREMSADNPIVSIENRVFVAGGELRWMQFVNRGLFDAEGSLKEIQSIGRDITRLKEIEADLLEARESAELASQSKTHFLAAVSHDLRQPLQAILLYSEVLLASKLDEKQKHVVEKLLHSSRALGDILNQLLDLVRLDSGKVQAEPEIFRAEDLLVTIDNEFSAQAALKQLRLDLFLSRRCPLLLTDQKLLMNILRNLVGNAVKFTERGRILLAIRRCGERALIQVWDTGIGIPQNSLDSIFDEYVQIDNPQRNRSQGVGLGLAAARRLAELLDTKIRYRSRVGKGAVFELDVPMATREPGGGWFAPETLVTDVPAQSMAKRVLIVEDDYDLAAAMKLAFENSGMQVIHFGSAEDALSSSAVDQADYCVCDFRLPGMDGLHFLNALRKTTAGTIRALLLTGEMAPDIQERIMESGWSMLSKPVQFDKLLSALAVSPRIIADKNLRGNGSDTVPDTVPDTVH